MALPQLLPIRDLPIPGDLVWCKFPKPRLRNENRVARAVLVRRSEIRRHQDGYDFGVVTVTYGTDAAGHGDRSCDFFLDWPEWKDVGLHKATVFILSMNDTKTLLWRDDFFVTQGYVVNQSLLIGRLSDEQMARLAEQAAKPRP